MSSRLVIDPWLKPWVFSGWFTPYDEIGQLVRRIKMSGDAPYDSPAEQIQYHNEMLAKQAGSTIALGSLRNPPVRKIVEAQIKELEAQVKERREFLTLLDANPGTEAVLDKLRKLHI